MDESLVASHPDVSPLLTQRAQRAKLLEAMVQAVAEKGYEAATVADAVRLARVSRGTFYELFDSKESCYSEAFRLGVDVMEERVDAAAREHDDWREQLRAGVRAYLQTLASEPRFARVYLAESHAAGAERDAAIRRFARRYGLSFARSGRAVPPDGALFLLAAGVGDLAAATLRAGGDILELEDTMVGCAVRLATEEERWT